MYKDFELTFEHFTNLNMYNVAIIFWSTLTSRHQILTYNPFLDTRVENKTSATTFQDIFYNKYANLYGKTLQITQFNDPLRSFVHNETYISGTDGKALALLCKKLNATYRVVGPKGSEKLAYRNVVFDVFNGSADMNFNKRAFYSSNYLNSSIIPVYPYEIDGVVILVPKAGPYPPFYNLLLPIESTSRFILMAVFLVMAIVWFVFLYFYGQTQPRISDVLLDTLRLQLATSLSRNVANFHERMLICGFMVYGFIVISGYQTILISVLMSPRSQPDLQTLAEVNATKMDLHIPNWIDRLRGSSVDIPLINRVFETNLTMWELRNSRLSGTDFGYMTTDQVALFFLNTTANIQNGRPLMHMIEERIFLAPSTYLLKRSSPYETIISSWISWFREAGLYQKFHSDSFTEAKREKRLEAEETNMMATLVFDKMSVDFTEILPAFMLLGFGCTVASLVFVGEVVYSRIVEVGKKGFLWRMRACNHCGAPRLVKQWQPTEAGLEKGVLPWVD
jgi:hypothetical protein